MTYQNGTLFTPSVHDLGVIKAGEPIKLTFEKVGDWEYIPVITASCGCTVPEYKGNTLEAIFTPKNTPHIFDKIVTVTVETSDGNYDRHLFHIKGRAE